MEIEFPPFLRDFCLWLFPGDPQFWKSLCSWNQLFADPWCWELPELSWWYLSAGSCISGHFLSNTVPQGRVACLLWSPNHTVPLLKIMSSTLLLMNQPQDWLSSWECWLGVRCPRFIVWRLPHFQLAWLEAIYLVSLYLSLPISRISGVALLWGLLGGWSEPVLLRHINVTWPMLTPRRSSCHHQHQSFCLFPTCWDCFAQRWQACASLPRHLGPSEGPRLVLPDPPGASWGAALRQRQRGLSPARCPFVPLLPSSPHRSSVHQARQLLCKPSISGLGPFSTSSKRMFLPLCPLQNLKRSPMFRHKVRDATWHPWCDPKSSPIYRSHSKGTPKFLAPLHLSPFSSPDHGRKVDSPAS